MAKIILCVAVICISALSSCQTRAQPDSNNRQIKISLDSFLNWHISFLQPFFKEKGLGNVKISTVNGENIYSLPQEGVKIGRNLIQRILERHGIDQGGDLLIFLIAHEYAHQLQFMQEPAILTTSSCDEHRLYEAQADMLAGYWIALIRRHFSEPNFSANKFIGLDILQNVHSLGDPEFSLGSHPTLAQRRNAFRLGLEYEDYLGSPTLDRNKLLSLDFRPGESLLDWSFRVSKHVVHFPLSPLKDLIVLQNDPKNHLRIDSGLFFNNLFYRDTVKNIGKRPIGLFCQYRVLGLNRKTKDSKMPVLYGDVKNFYAIIPPGGYHVFDDSLDWTSVSDENYNPALADLTSQETLYDANYVDGYGYIPDDFCVQSPNFNLVDTNDTYRTDFTQALVHIARYTVEQFELFKSGIGVLQDSVLFFKSNYSLPNASLSISEELNRNSKTTFRFEYDSTFLTDSVFDTIWSQLRQLVDQGVLRLQPIDERVISMVKKERLEMEGLRDGNYSIKDKMILVEQYGAEIFQSLDGKFNDLSCRIHVEYYKSLDRAQVSPYLRIGLTFDREHVY